MTFCSRSPLHSCALALALGLAGACKPTKAPAPAPAPKQTPQAIQSIAPALQAIVDRWLLTRPTEATSLGEHRHDGRWPDLSPEGIAADRARIRTDLAELDRLAQQPLTLDDKVDLGMLRAKLESQEFVHEREQPYQRNPLWYVSTIGSGLEDLISRDYADLNIRATAVAERLEALPKLVAQARSNLVAPQCLAPHTQVALGEFDGVLSLLQERIPELIAEASPEIRQRIRDATPKAAAAVQDFATFVENTIEPDATGTWRLGPEAFQTKLRLTLQSSIDAEQLRLIATVEHGRVRRDMFKLADELAPTLLTVREYKRLKARPGTETELVRAVLAELAVAHVKAPQLRDAVEATVQRLDQFVRTRPIVNLDEAEVLKVIWTPPHQVGVFVAGLAAPGPLEPRAVGLPSFYLVQPIPDDWPDRFRESLLREYNNFMLEILSIHEAIPGHFVQQYYARRDASKVRRVLANDAFVEGWAVYAEHVMLAEGYFGAPPSEATRPRGISPGLWQVLQDDTLRGKAIALHGLKFYLRTVTNALLDYGAHAGAMTEDEAVNLMTKLSFQEEEEARLKWVRAQITSTQLSTYFVGLQGWLRIRAHGHARARQQGVVFDLARFHDEVLRHGAPPLEQLPSLLGWETLSVAAPPNPTSPSAAPASSNPTHETP